MDVVPLLVLRGIAAQEPHDVPRAQVAPHRVPGRRLRVQQRLAVVNGRGRWWRSGERARAHRPAMEHCRQWLPDDRESRFPRAGAPVDVLVVREVCLVEEPDDAHGLGAHQEAAADGHLDRAPRVEAEPGRGVDALQADDAPATEVDLGVGDVEQLGAVLAQDGARYRRRAGFVVHRPEERNEEVGAHAGVVVEQKHAARARLERRAQARVVAPGIAAVLRQLEDRLVRKAGANRRDRAVARAVVDHQDRRAAERRAGEALEAPYRLVPAAPVEDDDRDFVRGQRRFI